MEDHVRAVHQLQHQRAVHHAVERVGEVQVALEVADVLDAAGREIVDHLHRPPPLQEGFRRVRSDEAGSATDQRSRHIRPCGDLSLRLDGPAGRANSPARRGNRFEELKGEKEDIDLADGTAAKNRKRLNSTCTALPSHLQRVERVALKLGEKYNTRQADIQEKLLLLLGKNSAEGPGQAGAWRFAEMREITFPLANGLSRPTTTRTGAAGSSRPLREKSLHGPHGIAPGLVEGELLSRS